MDRRCSPDPHATFACQRPRVEASINYDSKRLVFNEMLARKWHYREHNHFGCVLFVFVRHTRAADYLLQLSSVRALHGGAGLQLSDFYLSGMYLTIRSRSCVASWRQFHNGLSGAQASSVTLCGTRIDFAFTSRCTTTDIDVYA